MKMIKYLKLENFKGHSEIEVKFAEEVTFISGGNYKGKTTILEGIMFGLYGVSAVPGKGEHLWKKETKSTRVRLKFSIGQEEVAVERNRTSAVLFKNNVEIARGTTAVNKALSELIGLSQADFSRIKYSQQGETSALLTFGSTALNTLIERVSGATLIAKVLILLKKRDAEEKGMLMALQEVPVEPIKEEIEANSKELRISRENLVVNTDEAKIIRFKKKQASEKLIKLQNEQKKLEFTEQRLEELADRMDTADSETVSLENELLQFGTVDLTPDYIESLEEELHVKKERLEDHNQTNKSLLKFKDSIRDKNENLTYLNKAVITLTGAIEQREVTIKELKLTQIDTNSLGMETAIIKSELESLSNIMSNSVCPTCERPFEEHFNKNDIELKIGKLNGELTEKLEILTRGRAAKLDLETTLNRQERDQRDLDIKERDTAVLVSTITDLEINLNELEEDINKLPIKGDLEVEIKKIIKELKKAKENQLKAVELQAKLDSTKARHKEYLDEYSELNNQIRYASNNYKEDVNSSIQETKKIVDNFSEQVVNLASEDARLKSSINHIDEQLQISKNDLKVAEKNNTGIKDLEKMNGITDRLKKHLKSNREKFMTQVWDNLLSTASTLCSQATGGYISNITRDSDSFCYVEQGHVMPISAASGAQKSIMGLAIKVALSISLQDNTRCMLLDEVSSQMDEPHAAAVTALLGSLGHQVIAVSHRDLDRSGDYNLIDLGY